MARACDACGTVVVLVRRSGRAGGYILGTVGVGWGPGGQTDGVEKERKGRKDERVVRGWMARKAKEDKEREERGRRCEQSPPAC